MTPRLVVGNVALACVLVVGGTGVGSTVVACTEERAPPSTVEALAAAPGDPPPRASKPPVTMSLDPFVRPAPEGETFALKQGESARTKGGLVVTYAGHAHKHAAKGGRDAQTIHLSLQQGERRGDVELRGVDDVLEGELDALGTLLVVRGGYSRVDVTVAAEQPPAPMDRDEAWALIEEVAEKLRLPKDGGGGSVVDGIVRYGAVHDHEHVWDARFGLYTRRLWFVKPGE